MPALRHTPPENRLLSRTRRRSGRHRYLQHQIVRQRYPHSRYPHTKVPRRPRPVFCAQHRAQKRMHLLRLLDGRAFTRADRPNGFVRHDDTRCLLVAQRVEHSLQLGADNRFGTPRLPCRIAFTHADDGRSSRRPARARSLAATSASSSLWYARRSECPTTANVAPNSATIAAATSPVKAPCRCAETSCEPHCTSARTRVGAQ